MNQERIGKFISKLRKDKKITQEELAEKLHISSKSISRWETGKCMPDISLLIPLSEILEVSVQELITGEYIETKNIKEKTETAIKETINYSNNKLKKEKKKIIKITICFLLITSIILGIIDYTRIKYGEDPLFMVRITSGEKTIHHYIGLGYRVERKVGVSFSQPFINSEYVKFGPWLFTREIDIITAIPDYIYITTKDKEIRANRGGGCWSEKHISQCTDTLSPTEMQYEESISSKLNEQITVKHSYGNITDIKAYRTERVMNEYEEIELIPQEVELEFKQNKITAPSKKGVYYIVVDIEANEGKVWHSFKVYVDE